MKLQKTTLVLMITALVLAIGVYFLELQRETQQGNPQSNAQGNQQQLFNFTLAEITDLTITSKGQTIEITKGDQKTSLWQMKSPENVPANDAVVDFLLSLLVDTRVNSPLTVDNNQFIEYGLHAPIASIETKLQNQQIHQLFLGQQTFDKSSLYAYKALKVQAPQPNQPLPQVFIVPLNFQNAVDRSLSEWKKDG
ncbi:MAG: DUF4340 domain-containing protein [Coleofasciculaceae cyanobacterium SM2_1_6]|nr:DUF4340 domain-containing protein [Coleofasciculaceae cyanobacterium SM2_1_6]